MALEYTSQLLGYKPENGTAFPPAEQVDDKVEVILPRFGGHEDKVVLSSSTYGRF